MPTDFQRPPAGREQLSPEELSEVLKEASRRHGSAQKQATEIAGATTMDDAVAIARELGIPEAQVRAAAAGIRTRRKRARRFGVTLAFTAIIGTLFILLGVKSIMLYGILFALVLVVGMSWAFSALQVGAAEAAASAPVPGICRVCGRKAHTPESTFCEEHRFKTEAERKE